MYSRIKATPDCQISSPSYQVNSLNFDSEKISVITPQDHLNFTCLTFSVVCYDKKRRKMPPQQYVALYQKICIFRPCSSDPVSTPTRKAPAPPPRSDSHPFSEFRDPKSGKFSFDDDSDLPQHSDLLNISRQILFFKT